MRRPAEHQGKDIPWLIPPRLFLLCVLGMAALAWAWPGAEVLDFPWTLAGAGVMAAGLAVSLSGRRTFARHDANVWPFTDPTHLVTDGPYRFTRNPMYLGLVIVLAGWGLLLGAATPFLALPVFVIVCDRWYIPFEEARLAAIYGAAYDAYRARVRRWV